MSGTERKRRVIRLAGRKPGTISWFIGGLTLFVAVAFLYSLHSVSSALYLARLSSDLSAKLKPQTNARTLMLRPRYADILPKDQRNLQKLFELSDAVQRLDLKEARSLLKRQSVQQQRFETIESKLNSLEAQLKLSDRLVEKRAALGSTESSLDAQYRELLEKTRELLGLPPLSEEDLSRTDYGEFYTAGVLQGLPRLSAIPDSIETLQALAPILAAVRGPGKAPTISQKALDPLREDAKALISADEALVREEESIRNEESAQKSDSLRLQEEAVHAVHQAILSQQEIRLDNLTLRTYIAIRPFLQSVGVRAPEFPPGSVETDDSFL